MALLPASALAQASGNAIKNLHAVKQSADGTEVTFTLDYSYDGSSGATARLLPVIAEKDQRKVSSFFGADPVSIPTGSGNISITVKFFNDDPGAAQGIGDGPRAHHDAQ